MKKERGSENKKPYVELMCLLKGYKHAVKHCQCIFCFGEIHFSLQMTLLFSTAILMLASKVQV